MEPLSESSIRIRTSEKVFARGVDLCLNGAIRSLARRGSQLSARVEGSDIKPYRVTVSWSEYGEVEADCSCPYSEDWDDWCKHIVAVLLAFGRNDERMKQQPSLEEWLEPFDKAQLVELLLALQGRNAAIYDEVVAVITGEEPDDDDEEDAGW